MRKLTMFAFYFLSNYDGPRTKVSLSRDISTTSKKKFIVNVAVYLAHLNALYTHLNTITTKNGNKHIVLSLDLLHVREFPLWNNLPCDFPIKTKIGRR